MADEQEEIEIDIKLEKAKGKLGDLKDELERLRRENGEITLGLVGSSVGAGLQSAAGQTGSSIASFAADPVSQSIKLAVEGIAQQFPHLLAVLDTISGSAVAGRVGPIAEQYARLTGQQLPESALSGLVQQAQGPELAAAEARRRTTAASNQFAPDSSLGPIIQPAGSVWSDLEQLYRRYWQGAPPTPRALGGG